MWSNLYKSYAEFYKVPMNNEILEKLWGWIHDDIHIVKGICFEIDSKNAKKLYDKIANNTGFELYELKRN